MKNLPASQDFNDRDLIESTVQKKSVHDAMQHHVKLQKDKLHDQANLLIKQYKELIYREKLAEKIYSAQYNFQPVLLQIYSLYESEKSTSLSLIGPQEWSGVCPFGNFVGFVRQLGDATWEIIDSENT
tara:strand:- start:211 stop:594 length:384 start_codon:yes stop_codon:yes gene_type:complete